MRLRLPLLVIAVALLNGCSLYDVTAISADIALAAFTDVNKDKKPFDEDRITFWDPEVSRCIKVENEINDIEQQLDAIESGKSHVVLPTGERYELNPLAPDLQGRPGAYETCL